MSRTINFDHFRAEQNEEPVTLIIGGEEYALPASLPASMAIDMMSMQEAFQDEDAEVPTDAMDTFGRSLFSETVWEGLLRRHRITVTELPVLMEMVFKEYSDEVPKEDPGSSETPDSTSETPESASTSSDPGPG